MKPTFPTHNDALFGVLSPFVSRRTSLAALDLTPFGLPTRWHMDPEVAADGEFFRLLQRLDQLTLGPRACR